MSNGMFRSRGENLRSIYILLFLNVAFFLLQYQDTQLFARLFAFERHAVARGEVWRVFTYQFFHAARIGLFAIPPAFVLFLNLIVLTLMGMSVEEEWGTSHFLRLYFISTLLTAAAGAWLGIPLLGSFFINFTLLFVYASINRYRHFYLPILTVIALASLAAGVLSGIKASLAALIGSAAGYAYFLSQRQRNPVPAAPPKGFAPAPVSPDVSMVTATRNLTRVAAMKKALSTGSHSDIDRLIALSEREAVRGVNICPPVDFKPEHQDRYCVRCEGFAECAARHLRLNRGVATTAPATPAQTTV
jgi:membrane associated rhomboid family serine protease